MGMKRKKKPGAASDTDSDLSGLQELNAAAVPKRS